MAGLRKKRSGQWLIGRVGLAVLLVLVVILGDVNTAAAETGIVHPGLMYSGERLREIHDGYADGKEPFASSAERILNGKYAGSGLRKAEGRIVNDKGNHDNLYLYVTDCNIAFESTLAWVLTGEQKYADTAISALDYYANAFLDKKITFEGSDIQLTAAQSAFRLANAAEILRHYGESGWTEAQAEQFEDFLTEALVPIIKDEAAYANWGTGCLKAMYAVGIFCDNREYMDWAVNCYKESSNTGILNVALESGQNRESGRDHIHSQILIGHLAEFAWCAQSQGLDMFGYGDRRLLAAYEYMASYMLGQEVAYDPNYYSNNYSEHPPEMDDDENRGNLLPMYEIVVHYLREQGLAEQYPYTVQAALLTGNEYAEAVNYDGNHLLGFGTLAAAEGGAPAVPQGITVRAVNGCRMRLSWSQAEGAAGYNIYRSEAAGDGLPALGSYRKMNNEPVTECTYLDTDAVGGNTYAYRIMSVSESGLVSGNSVPVTGTAEAKKPLLPVQAVTVQEAGANLVRIAWEEASGAEGYEIYLAVDGGPYGKITDTPIRGTVAYQGGIQPNRQYSYRVRAVNSTGQGTLSKEAVLATGAQNTAAEYGRAYEYPRKIVLAADADWTISADGTVDAGAEICRNSATERSFLSFALDEIILCDGERVEDAVLHLYRGGDYAGFSLSALDTKRYSGFTEEVGGDGFTLSGYQPGNFVYAPDSSALQSLASVGKTVFNKEYYDGKGGYGIHLTDYVGEKLASGENLAFMLTADNSAGMGFYSRNSSEERYRPVITITIGKEAVQRFEEAYREPDAVVEYEVSFNRMGRGSYVKEQKVARGGQAQDVILQTAGYRFTGWYMDKDCSQKYDFTQPVTQDMVLYAGWQAE